VCALVSVPTATLLRVGAAVDTMVSVLRETLDELRSKPTSKL
jgi:hypothetical protein